MTDDEIRELFLANGFTIKEGQTDLKPYVYQAARALLSKAASAQATPTVEELAAVLREGALVTRSDAWTLAERVHEALAHPQQAKLPKGAEK